MKINWRSLILILTLLIIFLLYYVLLKIDVATAPIPQDLVPEITTTAYQARDPVVLVTYADGPVVFFKNQNALSARAINKGIDHIHIYRRGHIGADFYEKNKKILSQKRGAGYWLWKPYFILKTMAQYPDNTTIIYADSGVVLTKPLGDLFQLLKQNDMVLVGHGRPVPLRFHLKKEAQKILSIEGNQSLLNSQNIWGFFMVIRNTPAMRDFVQKWLALCETEAALTDEPFDPSSQEPGFVHHEHDQSLLSILVAQQPDKKMIIKRNELRNTYGIVNNHRHPEEEDTSPLFIAAGLPQWLSDLLYNNSVMRKIRRTITE
jgi:hypothetical protein